MTDTTREELFSVLQELWTEMPDFRFGQLIVNLAYAARDPSHEAPWDVEDTELLAAAQNLLNERRSQQTAHTSP